MAYNKSNNPTQRRGRRRRKGAKHLLNTPTIEVQYLPALLHLLTDT